MNESPVLEFHVPLPFEQAEEAVRDALAAQGFGILTEVDVRAVLKAKLGMETSPQKLLGACNPQLAHSALLAEPSVGAFLPCGVALREGGSPGETIVALQNPSLLGGLFGGEALDAPADEASKRLRAALGSVGTPA